MRCWPPAEPSPVSGCGRGLYVLPTSRERDESKGQADIQIKPYGQAGYSVIVEVDLLADGGSTVTGVESYAFPYEFLEDRWVFTDFHLIY